MCGQLEIWLARESFPKLGCWPKLSSFLRRQLSLGVAFVAYAGTGFVAYRSKPDGITTSDMSHTNHILYTYTQSN